MAMFSAHVFLLYLAVTTVTVTVVKVSSQDNQGEQTVWICEGQEKTIRCNKQATINIISAFYGRKGDAGHCFDHDFTWHPCNSDATTIVQGICNGRYTCRVRSNNDAFGGDPCPLWGKFLRLTYSCNNVATTPVARTTEETYTKTPTTAALQLSTEITLTSAEPLESTGSITSSQTTVDSKQKTAIMETSDYSIQTTATTLKGNSGALDSNGHASKDNTVIIVTVAACVAAAILAATVAGFILWKRRKRPDSAESPTNIHNSIYDEVTTSSNIQLTNTGATYRTDGNCNPTEPANIADLYAKPNKKKSAPNVDQLYAKPIKNKTNHSNVDQMYAKPHKTTSGSSSPCNSEPNNEEVGSVDNMLYESTGTITFSTTGNEEGYVDNELYGSTA